MPSRAYHVVSLHICFKFIDFGLKMVSVLWRGRLRLIQLKRQVTKKVANRNMSMTEAVRDIAQSVSRMLDAADFADSPQHDITDAARSALANTRMPSPSPSPTPKAPSPISVSTGTVRALASNLAVQLSLDDNSDILGSSLPQPRPYVPETPALVHRTHAAAMGRHVPETPESEWPTQLEIRRHFLAAAAERDARIKVGALDDEFCCVTLLRPSWNRQPEPCQLADTDGICIDRQANGCPRRILSPPSNNSCGSIQSCLLRQQRTSHHPR